MKSKRRLASVTLELAAVLLVTALAFAWGVQAARAERGCTAIGGEYLLLLLPAMYYIGKRTILDWIAGLREREKAMKRVMGPLLRECGDAGEGAGE